MISNCDQVYLDDNRLATIPDSLTSLPRLNIVSVASNDLGTCVQGKYLAILENIS